MTKPDLTVMAADIAEIKRIVIKTDETIHGNGEIGLKTRVFLNAAAVRRLYWILGLTVLTVLGAVVRVLTV